MREEEEVKKLVINRKIRMIREIKNIKRDRGVKGQMKVITVIRGFETREKDRD